MTKIYGLDLETSTFEPESNVKPCQSYKISGSGSCMAKDTLW